MLINLSIDIHCFSNAEGQFATLEASFCLLRTIITVLHLFWALFLKTSILYIFSFPVGNPL
jgi:hypothetical protein